MLILSFKSVNCLLCALYLTGLAFFAHAEDDLFGDELPVVISASRLNQSVLTSPSAVTVIDKEMIAASGFTELVDLLRLVPGFQVAHSNGRTFAATYHGFGSDIGNHLQVLINGRSTYTPTFSTVDWNLLGITLEDIEKVEVIRGSSASAYGSNSFRAAINIITRSPQLDNTFYVQSRAGTANERQQMLRLSGSTESLSYRFTSAVRQDDGLDDNIDFRKLSHFNLHTLSNYFRKHPINFYAGYTSGSLGTDNNESIFEPRDREVESWYLQLQGKQIISPNQDITWNLYHNRDSSDDRTRTILLSEFPDPIPVDQSTSASAETNDASKTDLEITYNNSSNSAINFMVGMGQRFDKLKSLSYAQNEGTISGQTQRVFGNTQISFGPYTSLNAGAIYENNTDDIEKVSSRASINQKLTDSQSLRIAASTGYRLPSLLELNFKSDLALDDGTLLFPLYRAGDDIQPEKITGYEIGYLGQLKSAPLSWDVKIYYDHLENIIGLPKENENQLLRTSYNNGDYKVYGFEGEMNYRQNKQQLFKLLFNFSHGKLTFLEDINPGNKEVEYSATPTANWGALSSSTFDQWKVNFGLYHISEMRWFNAGSLVDSYTRLDLSVNYDFDLKSNNAALKFTVQNLGGKHAEYDDEREVDTRYMLTFSLSQD